MQNQHSTSNQSHGSSSNAEHPSFPGSSQVRKFNFDFPRFDGTNALEWIFNANKFFDYYHIPDLERVSIASMHMDKGAVHWFQMMQRNLPFRSWHDLKRAIEMEFGPSLFDCPRASLFKLTQTGSVGDYYSEFTALANRVHVEPPEALLDCFISGLQPELKRDVLSQCPSTLMRAVSLAKLYEDKYSTSFKPVIAPNISRPYHQPHFAHTPRPPTKPTLPPLLPTPPTKPTPVRRITPAEMQLRREKGLCYWCDEKFSFNHKCPNRHLMLLQAIKDEPAQEENQAQPTDVEVQPIPDQQQP